MDFVNAVDLKTKVSGLSMDGTPAPAQLGDNIYVFFKQKDTNKIKYIIGKPGDANHDYKWTGVFNVDDHIGGVGIATNTSPCVITVGQTMYVFYNGSGDNGTWYFEFDGWKWSEPKSIRSLIMNMGFSKGTSPSAVYTGKYIYLFWVDYDSGDIFYSIKMGEIWTGPISIKKYTSNVGIAGATSPCAVIYGGFIHVFYNGAGNDGTFYVKMNNESWEKPVSIKAKIGPMGFAPKTSPAVICRFSIYKLYLTWVGIGRDGIFYSIGASLSQNEWTSQKKLECPNLIPMTANGSNASGLILHDMPYVFWHAKDTDSLWMTWGTQPPPVPA